MSTYEGKLPSITLQKTTDQIIKDAILWAKWIAGDNRFHYGYTNKKKGINAHHNGCYFCGTNTTKGGRSKKGIVDYKFSYCCNPYIGAAWAHGGGIPKALSLCQHGGSWGFEKGSGYDASPLFKKLGHPSLKKLKPGDVLCCNYHVAMYIGNNKIIESSGGDDNVKNSKKWNHSIRIRTITKQGYKKFPRVYRYKGGAIKTSTAIRHGEVSYRVPEWQAFLDWYFKGKVGKPDVYFGDNTLKWTKKFQKEQGLKDDGVVGKKTLEKAKIADRDKTNS